MPVCNMYSSGWMAYSPRHTDPAAPDLAFLTGAAASDVPTLCTQHGVWFIGGRAQDAIVRGDLVAARVLRWVLHV